MRKKEVVNNEMVNFLERTDPVDLGLSTGQINSTRQVLQMLQKHPQYPKGYDLTLKPLLDEQDRLASLRELGQQLKDSQVAMTRRDFLRLAKKVGILGIVAAAGILLYNPVTTAIYNGFFSPEAVASREENDRLSQEAEKAKLEQAKQEKIKAEDNLTLGLNATALSINGFYMHYNPKDEKVRYVPVDGALSFFNLDTRHWVNWNETNDKGRTVAVETGIYIDTYTRSDGVKVPCLITTVKNQINISAYLRDNPTDTIDNSVVAFEDSKNKKTYLFAINPLNDSTYQFRLMRKETISDQ